MPLLRVAATTKSRMEMMKIATTFFSPDLGGCSSGSSSSVSFIYELRLSFSLFHRFLVGVSKLSVLDIAIVH
jgi:hypothetical protein